MGQECVTVPERSGNTRKRQGTVRSVLIINTFSILKLCYCHCQTVLTLRWDLLDRLEPEDMEGGLDALWGRQRCANFLDSTRKVTVWLGMYERRRFGSSWQFLLSTKQ